MNATSSKLLMATCRQYDCTSLILVSMNCTWIGDLSLIIDVKWPLGDFNVEHSLVKDTDTMFLRGMRGLPFSC